MDNAAGNGTATLADSEAETFVHGDRSDEGYLHLDVIARHYHLYAVRQLDGAGNVSRPEIELRTIAAEERGVTAAFFLGQDVYLAVEVRVRMYRAGLCQNLAALDLVTLYAAQQHADVIARYSLVKQLAEHLYAGDHGGTLLVAKTNYLYRILYLYGSALYTAGCHGAAAGDAEHVLNRHEERLVGRALRFRYVLVYSVHKLEYALALLASLGYAAVLQILKRLQRAALDDGYIIPGEVVA